MYLLVSRQLNSSSYGCQEWPHLSAPGTKSYPLSINRPLEKPALWLYKKAFIICVCIKASQNRQFQADRINSFRYTHVYKGHPKILPALRGFKCGPIALLWSVLFVLEIPSARIKPCTPLQVDQSFLLFNHAYPLFHYFVASLYLPPAPRLRYPEILRFWDVTLLGTLWLPRGLFIRTM